MCLCVIGPVPVHAHIKLVRSYSDIQTLLRNYVQVPEKQQQKPLNFHSDCGNFSL